MAISTNALRLGLLLILVALVPASAQVTETVAQRHMIAAANPHAAQAGLEILRAGGSAVDAAITTQLVLGLVEPESSGIGGGAFMLAYDAASGRTTSFDGREKAPASARPGMFLGTDGNPRPKSEVIPGGLSVGIPGVVGMLDLAHKKYGKLPWAALFQPAIKLAENGFAVGPKLARAIRSTRSGDMPDIKKYFFHADGTPLKEGEILKNPEYGASLRKIAAGGLDAFYKGEIARAIINAVQNAPGLKGGMTLADLADYRAQERAPVCGDYREYRVCSMGPPSSGGIAVLQILGALQRFPASQLQPGTVSNAHLFAQASRLAYADRAKYLADPAFVPVPIAGLTDSKYIAGRAALIDPAKDMGTAQPGTPPGEKRTDYAPQISPGLPGTSHLTIVDDKGNVVAMTTSVETGFGAKIMAGGFILNNTLTDFSLAPVRDGLPVANAPAPGKLPLSSMTPTIVFDKDRAFLLSVGSPGGPAIIDYVAQTVSGILDGKLTPKQAIAMPRELNMNGPTLLENGPGVDRLAGELRAMGHTVQIPSQEGSGLHGIMKVTTGYIGAADPRRDGVALGD